VIATDPADATIIVAGIAALAGIASTVLSLQTKRNQNTGNNHTIGRGVARLEDRFEEHENRLDRIEVRFAENFGDIRELLNDASSERQRIKFDSERHLATYKHQRRLVDE